MSIPNSATIRNLIITNLGILALGLVTLALCFVRIDGHRGDLFKTTAHFFVAGFIMYAILGRSRARSWCGWFAAVLCVVEIVCFLVSQFSH